MVGISVIGAVVAALSKANPAKSEVLIKFHVKRCDAFCDDDDSYGC
jgi:hypothetical protein